MSTNTEDTTTVAATTTAASDEVDTEDGIIVDHHTNDDATKKTKTDANANTNTTTDDIQLQTTETADGGLIIVDKTRNEQPQTQTKTKTETETEADAETEETPEATASIDADVDADDTDEETANNDDLTAAEAEAGAAAATAALALSNANPDELDANLELQLQYRWALWYSAPKKKNVDQKKWDTERVKKVVEFGTVREFWQVFNNLSPPTTLEEGSDLHLFRSGVEPAWEDSFNTKGGTWKYTVSKDDMNEKLNTAWFNTVLSIIGDQFHDADDICGIVTSIRAKVNRIGLWIKHADDREAVKRIGKQLKEINRIKTRIYFISHDDAKDFGKPNKTSEMTL